MQSRLYSSRLRIARLCSPRPFYLNTIHGSAQCPQRSHTASAALPSEDYEADWIREKVADELSHLEGVTRKTKSRVISRAGVAFRKGQSAADALAEWIDLGDPRRRKDFWNQLQFISDFSSLPFVLLCYLNTPKSPIRTEESPEIADEQMIADILADHAFKLADVERWAWVLQGDNADVRAERFLSLGRKLPLFLLIEVLRGDVRRVDIFKGLVLHTRRLLLRNNSSPLSANLEEVESDRPATFTSWNDTSNQISGNDPAARLIFGSLFRLARQISPPALVSIAQIVFPYMLSSIGKVAGDPLDVDQPERLRLCIMYNYILQKLSWQAKIEPFRSMAYNWQAQRIVLEIGNQFKPPLLLSNRTYQSIVKVLIASKKSDGESKAADLRMRSWPPWRIEQDGMDAQRSREDDLSRAVLALIASNESGYSATAYDIAMGILGGQEPDGTPTTHKRTILNDTGLTSQPLPHHDLSPIIWAARIEATRDVEEAWSAFLAFTEAGGEHDSTTYSAMLEKLIFERLRLIGFKTKHGGGMGDAKEQLPPHNDGFSAYYRSQLQPPTLESLYRRMLRAGIKLPQRLLALLIETVPEPIDAIGYIRDAGMGKRTGTLLKGGHDTRSREILSRIPDQVFTSYIKMLCRFAPRAALKPINSPGARYRYDIINGGNLLPNSPKYADGPKRSNAANGAEDGMEWVIVELSMKPINVRFTDPLHLAAKLLTDRNPLFRPAWFCLFQALARTGLIHNRMVNKAKNDLLSWRVLEVLLSEFHGLGLELDPEGFSSVCWVVRKAVVALHDPSISRKDTKIISDDENGLGLLKSEFRKIIQTNDDESLPKFWYPIRGYVLHAYMLVLGSADDVDEIMFVLEWMVENDELLDSMAYQAGNGHMSLRRALIAAYLHLSQGGYAERAKALVDQAPMLGGWPSESEVLEYLEMSEAFAVDEAQYR